MLGIFFGHTVYTLVHTSM